MGYEPKKGSFMEAKVKALPCNNHRSRKLMQKRFYRLSIFTAILMFLCFQLNATANLESWGEKIAINATSSGDVASHIIPSDSSSNVQDKNEDSETLLEKIEYGIIKFFMARIVASHQRRRKALEALMNQEKREAEFKDRIQRKPLETDHEKETSTTETGRSSGSTKASSSGNKPKTILLYTRFFGRRSWAGIFGNSTDLAGHQCPVSNCVFTYDHSKLKEADALIFHSRDFKSRTIPQWRDLRQRYIWLYHEAPGMENAGISQLSDSFFNWTYTYHRDSDLLFLYGGVQPIHEDALNVTRPGLLDTSSITYQEYLSELRRRNVSLDDPIPAGSESEPPARPSERLDPPNRKKLVAWMVSHCSTWSGRELYVQELMGYLDVDIYGRCGSFTCGRTHHDSYCYSEVLAPNYKFYLAFENSICNDYITEKVWYPLHYGLVPVVYGGARYEEYLPPHSYIDATKLSPQELAVLLTRLGSSSDLYEAYHLWRKYWRVLVPPPMCELCQRLHFDHTPSTVKSPQKWWQQVNNCTTRYSFKDYPRQDLRLMVTKVDASIKIFRKMISSFL